jgi:hypothetical protein
LDRYSKTTDTSDEPEEFEVIATEAIADAFYGRWTLTTIVFLRLQSMRITNLKTQPIAVSWYRSAFFINPTPQDFFADNLDERRAMEGICEHF